MYIPSVMDHAQRKMMVERLQRFRGRPVTGLLKMQVYAITAPYYDRFKGAGMSEQQAIEFMSEPFRNKQ